MAKDPYKGSAYDAAGMPLGTTLVDCDNAEEVRQAMVKDKVVEPQNHVYDLDYEAKSIKTREYKSDVELNKENGVNKFAVGIPGIDSDINTADIGRENFDDILTPVLKASEKPEEKDDNDGKV